MYVCGGTVSAIDWRDGVFDLYTWRPPHQLLLPLKLIIRRDVEDELGTTVATWRRLRRREFVRDKLLSVNHHRGLINLGYRGSGSGGKALLSRHRVCANWREVGPRDGPGPAQHDPRAFTVAEAGTQASEAASAAAVASPVGRRGVRTTFRMIIEVDGCDRGRWKLCRGRTHLTSSRNLMPCTARMHATHSYIQPSLMLVPQLFICMFLRWAHMLCRMADLYKSSKWCRN